MTINRNNYELKYSAPLTPDTTLDNIYDQFNINRPADLPVTACQFRILWCVHRNGQDTAHYVDSIGFADVPGVPYRADAGECVPKGTRRRSVMCSRAILRQNAQKLAASDPDNDVFDGEHIERSRSERRSAYLRKTMILMTQKRLISHYWRKIL